MNQNLNNDIRTDTESLLRFSEFTGDITPLLRRANEVREQNVGAAVHLRGLIELSNFCRCRCAYCGINADNKTVHRYRMTESDVRESVPLAIQFGYGTIVFQSGEDFGLSDDFIARQIEWIKSLPTPWGQPLAVTLSLGQRSASAFALWRRAGADRYLIRFETSSESLFAQLHPHDPAGLKQREEVLFQLRDLGYQIGTGFLIGVPGQTRQDWVNDLETLRRIQPDMIGVGPYLPHPHTALGTLPPNTDVLSDKSTVLKTLALSRLICPRANIPSTTALAALDVSHGHEDGLCCGANVIMPNLTPAQYRKLYEIYPAKGATAEEAEKYDAILKKRIVDLGRTVGVGPGGRSEKLGVRS